MKKNLKKIFAVSLVALIMATGCGGKTGGSADGRTEITFYAGVSAKNGEAYEKMVETYNSTQGEIDGVYVNYKPKQNTYDADLSTVFAGKLVPDVLTLSDQYFKGYTKKDNLYNMQELVDDESLVTKNADGEVNLDLSKIPSNMVDRFRINWENKSSGSADDDLYAIPNGANPTYLYYNIDAFENAGVNIISVAEEDLDTYNSENGTSYMPHGYAEYSVDAAPAEGLKTSTNLAGQTVIKVFNNQIPMNWSELIVLAKYTTKSYTSDSKTEYGFLNEWWFSHGWSVGGDCMMWDEAKGQYVFSLGNDTSGYIAVSDVTVNGTDYKAGDVLSNVDKTYLSNNPSAVTADLYELPSQYDAFAEFCALSQVKGQAVDFEGKTGYGISPSPAKLGSYSKVTFFTAQNVAMLVDSLDSMNDVAQSVVDAFKWEVAPTVQYREYEGGDLNADGSLKVIGVAISLTCAVLLNQNRRFTKVYEVVLFVPYVCSAVAVAIMWRWMFNEDAGIINNILVSLFGEGAKVNWMTDPRAYRWMLFIITVWKDPGYGIIMYKAALKNIDKSLYEAGRIDGANEWNLFRYITFPKLSSTTLFLLLAGIINGMKCFDIAKIVSPLTWTGTAGPDNAGLTLVYYAYLEGVTWDNMSVASVVSWVLFIIIFILTYVNMKAKKLWGADE